MSSSLAFRNILIVRTDRVGDVVLTTPAIKALRKTYPASKLSVLVTPATLDLVKGNPYVDEILTDDRNGRNRGPGGFLRLVGELRGKGFDLAVIFHTKRRYNLACFLAGIGSRLGYRNEKFGFLLTQPLTDPRSRGQKHESEYCMDLVRALGAEGSSLDVLVPMQNEAEAWASSWMRDHGLSFGGFIVVHPGSSDPAKCWPPDDFAALLRRLLDRYTLKIVIVGAQNVKPVSDQILSRTGQKHEILNMTGKTSLAQLASLLKRARLLISNDSGPVHVCAGVGTPVISLFLRDQPGINPGRWQPLGSKGHVLCSSSIKVDDVLELVEAIFKGDHQYEIF